MGAELPVVNLGTGRTVLAVSLGVSFRFINPKPYILDPKLETRNPKPEKSPPWSTSGQGGWSSPSAWASPTGFQNPKS